MCRVSEYHEKVETERKTLASRLKVFDWIERLVCERLCEGGQLEETHRFGKTCQRPENGSL